MPPTVTVGSGPVYSTWWTDNCAGNYNACDPYTVVNLANLYNLLSTSSPLLLTIRETMPYNFGCSGFAVPFATAEYTNVDGGGAGLMGPYIPLADYVPVGSLLKTGNQITSSTLPSQSYCGVLATPSPANLPVYPAYNNPSIAVSGSYAGETNWPQQYWPTSGFGSSSQALLLNCLGTSASTTPPPNDPTEIYFVATQRATQTILKSGCSQSDYAATNPCTQVVAQSPQETYEYPSGSGMWQPQLPIKIVGQGFGTLPPSLGLPYAVQSSPYIEIADNGAGVNGFKWDTGNDTGGDAQCQIYVTNWTDSSISLVANAPIEDTDPINSSLSLLLDISPDTLTPRVQQGLNAFNCPVVGNDGMTFTVTNPQTRSSTTLLPTVNVQPLGTSPN